MKEFSPEEKAELQTDRAISDHDLIRGGAKFVPDQEGEPVLQITKEQLDLIKKKHNPDGSEKEKYEWTPDMGEMTYSEFKELADKMGMDGWKPFYPSLKREDNLRYLEEGRIELGKLYWNSTVTKRHRMYYANAVSIDKYGQWDSTLVDQNNDNDKSKRFSVIFTRHWTDSQ